MATDLDQSQDHAVMPAITTTTADDSRVLQRVTLPATQEQVAHARRITQRTIGDHPRSDDAILLVSELVTNVLLHSGASLFTLVVSETSTGHLKITVTDNGHAETMPRLSDDQPVDALSGRGMRLVDNLAQRWGVNREPAVGLGVWLVLDVQSLPPQHPYGRTFAELAHNLMAERGMPLDVLAAVTNYHSQHLSLVLHGRTPPSETVAARLDHALDAGGALTEQARTQMEQATRGDET